MRQTRYFAQRSVVLQEFVQCVQNFDPAPKFGHFWGFWSEIFGKWIYFSKLPNETSPKGEPKRQSWKIVFWPKISLKKPQKWPNWGSRTKILERTVVSTCWIIFWFSNCSMIAENPLGLGNTILSMVGSPCAKANFLLFSRRASKKPPSGNMFMNRCLLTHVFTQFLMPLASWYFSFLVLDSQLRHLVTPFMFLRRV